MVFILFKEHVYGVKQYSMQHYQASLLKYPSWHKTIKAVYTSARIPSIENMQLKAN